MSAASPREDFRPEATGLPRAGRGRRRSGVSAGVAVVVLLLGLVLWAGYRVFSGLEHHSYSDGGVAPTDVRVTAGKSYQLSVAGGVKSLDKRGVPASVAQCTWSAGDSAKQVLQVTAEQAGTKAINVVATFTAPTSGPIAIDCAGWGQLYVDDADNAGPDVAGWLLVGAVLALTVGVGLGLSALRGASLRDRRADAGYANVGYGDVGDADADYADVGHAVVGQAVVDQADVGYAVGGRAASAQSRQEDQIETGRDVGDAVGQDGEVIGDDGGDVTR